DGGYAGQRMEVIAVAETCLMQQIKTKAEPLKAVSL
ncbi:MAG: hypothetical protein K0S39_5505, partial [Paenibacillus sp.]|nr:hypothetical protein [Paenibacillus sp.]